MSKSISQQLHRTSIAIGVGVGAFTLSLAVAPANKAAAQSNWKPAWDKLVSSPSSWKAEWDKTVAAGNKEGKVVLLIPPSRTGRKFISKEWPKAFPDIKLSLTTLRSTQFVQRVRTERNAKQFLWDAALTGTGTGFKLRDFNALDPVRPQFILPGVKDPKTWGGWDKAFYDKGKEYVITLRQFLKMPFYNAKLLSPAKVKSMGAKALFLDPSMKQKFVWHNPLIGGSGRTFSIVMRNLLGDDGLRTFIKDQVVILKGMNDVVGDMARQKYAVSFGPIMTGLIKRYTKAGVDLDIRPLGNTPKFGAYMNTGGSSLIIMKNRPNPNALKLWVNWIMSKPVAAAMAEAMGEDSRRSDVASVVEPERQIVAGVDYIEPQREEIDPLNRKAQQFIRKAIGN